MVFRYDEILSFHCSFCLVISVGSPFTSPFFFFLFCSCTSYYLLSSLSLILHLFCSPLLFLSLHSSSNSFLFPFLLFTFLLSPFLLFSLLFPSPLLSTLSLSLFSFCSIFSLFFFSLLLPSLIYFFFSSFFSSTIFFFLLSYRIFPQ